jgi:hypothetical protein
MTFAPAQEAKLCISPIMRLFVSSSEEMVFPRRRRKRGFGGVI